MAKNETCHTKREKPNDDLPLNRKLLDMITIHLLGSNHVDLKMSAIHFSVSQRRLSLSQILYSILILVRTGALL